MKIADSGSLGTFNYHGILGIFDHQEEHVRNRAFNAEEDFQGSLSSRTSTNKLWLCYFIGATCVVLGLSVYIFQLGAPVRLSHGSDLRAEICGEGDLRDTRFLFYPDPENTVWGMCIEACPYYDIQDYYSLYDENGDQSDEWGHWDSYQTTSFGFYCLPVKANDRKEVLKKLSSAIEVLKRSSGDMLLAWDTVLLGETASVVVGIVALALLGRQRWVNGTLWSIVVVYVAVALCTAFLLVKAGDRAHHILCEGYGPAAPEYCDTSTELFFYSLAALSGVLSASTLFKLFRKINDFDIAVKTIQFAVQPLYKIKGMLANAFIQLLIGNSIIIVLSGTLCYAISIGSIVHLKDNSIPGGAAKTIEYSTIYYWLLILIALVTFWWLSFLVKLNEFIISGSVST